jgi:hypothetical protein
VNLKEKSLEENLVHQNKWLNKKLQKGDIKHKPIKIK